MVDVFGYQCSGSGRPSHANARLLNGHIVCDRRNGRAENAFGPISVQRIAERHIETAVPNP
jgi:hypothetical protein